MKLVTYSKQYAHNHDYDTCNSTVGIMDEGVKAVEKCAGKDGVGNAMQQLVNSYKLGQLDKIARLVG